MFVVSLGLGFGNVCSLRSNVKVDDNDLLRGVTVAAMTKWNTLLTIFHLSWSILWGWILGSRDSGWEWKHLWWSLSSSLGDTHRQSSWVWFTSFLIWSTLDSWILAGNCVILKHLWWQLPDSPDATHRPSSSPPAGPAPNDTKDQTAPSHLRRISLTRGFVICYLGITKWGRSNMKYLLKENGWKNILGGRSSIFEASHLTPDHCRQRWG